MAVFQHFVLAAVLSLVHGDLPRWDPTFCTTDVTTGTSCSLADSRNKCYCSHGRSAGGCTQMAVDNFRNTKCGCVNSTSCIYSDNKFKIPFNYWSESYCTEYIAYTSYTHKCCIRSLIDYLITTSVAPAANTKVGTTIPYIEKKYYMSFKLTVTTIGDGNIVRFYKAATAKGDNGPAVDVKGTYNNTKFEFEIYTNIDGAAKKYTTTKNLTAHTEYHLEISQRGADEIYQRTITLNASLLNTETNTDPKEHLDVEVYVGDQSPLTTAVIKELKFYNHLTKVIPSEDRCVGPGGEPQTGTASSNNKKYDLTGSDCITECMLDKLDDTRDNHDAAIVGATYDDAASGSCWCETTNAWSYTPHASSTGYKHCKFVIPTLCNYGEALIKWCKETYAGDSTQIQKCIKDYSTYL